MEFKVTSPAFGNGSLIPSRYTCDGEDINPHLAIHGVPEQARSLALVMESLDAPAGSRNHWIIWNIPPQTKEIREHSVPFHTEVGVNSMGKNGYVGPCPPSGTQRYLIRLFALDRKLELGAEAGRDALDKAMEFHILASAELLGSYARSNEGPV